MLKLCGAALTFAGCSLLGIWMQRQLFKRVSLMETLAHAFSMLRTEIAFLQTPLPQAVEKAAAANPTPLLCVFSAQLKQEKTPYIAMQAALSEESGVLTKADAAVLLRAAAQLGASDAASQAEQLCVITEQLYMQRRAAAEHAQTNGRLYMASGVFGGALLVLLML